MNTHPPARVLIIDDSALVRQILSDILSSDVDIEVVGVATNPFMAREKIKRLNPNVLTLDVEMPQMDGLVFLENLMRLRPIPVVMISSLTEKGAQTTFQALSLGAVDFVAKPKFDVARGLEQYAADIQEKVKSAAQAHVQALPARIAKPSQPTQHLARVALTTPRKTQPLIAIGASAGGTEALRIVLEHMPTNAPPIVLTQHLPAGFSAAFAERLNRHSALTVQEAQEGEPILSGHAYLPPGGKHLRIFSEANRWYAQIDDGPPVNRHKPAVDVLFRSVALCAGRNAIGALLTGMGDDGARGLLEMRQAGAATLAQDEMTSLVWGMPKVAYKLGAVQELLPLDHIAQRLITLSNMSSALYRNNG